MEVQAKSRLPWLRLLLLTAALAVGAILWIFKDKEPVHESAGALPPKVAPPPAVYVTPDAHPRTSVKGTAASVSESAVRLQLFATFPGRSPREGTALLGTDSNNPQTYGVGSVLASGAVVEEIHADFVLLVLAGQRSKLYRVGFAGPEDEQLLAATTVGGPGIADRPIEQRASSQQDYVDFIRPKLVFDGDKLTGFEIGAGRMRHVLANLGLESGDIVRSIDGRPVVADSDWQRVADTLGRGGSIVLGIERQGSLLSISMDASQLTKSSTSNDIAVPPPMPSSS